MDGKFPTTRSPLSSTQVTSAHGPGSESKAGRSPAPLATLRAGLADPEREVQLPLVGLSGKAGGVKRKREDEEEEVALPSSGEAVLASALAATAGQVRAQARTEWLERMTQLGGATMPAVARASVLQMLKQAAGMESIAAEALAGMCEAVCQGLGGAAMPQERAHDLLDGVHAAARSARDGARCLALGVAANSALDFCGAGRGHQQAMLRNIVQHQHLMSGEFRRLCCASLASAPQPPDRTMLRDLLQVLVTSAGSLPKFGSICQDLFEGLQCSGLAPARRRLDPATRGMLFDALLELAPRCEVAVRAQMLRRACAALRSQPADAQVEAGLGPQDRRALWDALAARASDPKLSPSLVQEMAADWVHAVEASRMDQVALATLASAAATCAARLDASRAPALAEGLTRQLRKDLEGLDGLRHVDAARIGDVFRVLASADGLTPAQRGALARGMALASAGEAALEGHLREAVARSGVSSRHMAAMVLGDCVARRARGVSTEDCEAFWAEAELPGDRGVELTVELEMAVELACDPMFLLVRASTYSEEEQLGFTVLALTIAGPWDAQALSRRIGQVVNKDMPEPLRIEAMLRFAQEGHAQLPAPLFSIMRGLAIEQVRQLHGAGSTTLMPASDLASSRQRALSQLQRLMALCPREMPAAALRREIAAIERAKGLPEALRASLVQPLRDALKALGQVDHKAG